MKKSIISFLVFNMIAFSSLVAQAKLTNKEFEDFARQAQKQVLLFFDSVKDLGASNLSPDIQEKAIKNITKTFSENGTVEERSKRSKTGRVRLVDEYLRIIAARGQKTPVLVSYDFVDPLTYEEFKPTKNSDGSTTYKGEMIVKQYYCKLKPIDDLNDKLNSNCAYEDTTIKKITVEIRLLNSQFGKSFAVLITNISVLSVS